MKNICRGKNCFKGLLVPKTVVVINFSHVCGWLHFFTAFSTWFTFRNFAFSCLISHRREFFHFSLINIPHELERRKKNSLPSDCPIAVFSDNWTCEKVHKNDTASTRQKPFDGHWNKDWKGKAKIRSRFLRVDVENCRKPLRFQLRSLAIKWKLRLLHSILRSTPHTRREGKVHFLLCHGTFLVWLSTPRERTKNCALKVEKLNIKISKPTSWYHDGNSKMCGRQRRGNGRRQLRLIFGFFDILRWGDEAKKP